MEKKSMAMEDLLDMLQTARQKSGVVGIAQKPREQQGEILRSLMHKFDSKEDMQTVLDSKWGFGNKRKGTDPDEDVNVLECSKREK
tara:strand:- start:1549 stop:1806 length:258 start_codon:yes stop_codon:yes gene_type:complete